MANLIDEYFAHHLDLSWEDAVRLHKEYYTNYGLAIEGLVRHHQIDPLDYNSKVDDALPLEAIIKPNAELLQLLEDIDRDKVKLWLFTNAYVTHGKRVVRLLGVDKFFEGLTYCDYSKQPLVCKPSKEAFEGAMRAAGVERVEDCYFVGEFDMAAKTFSKVTDMKCR
jgi:pyrimidine and pyridine-specific 5'-nucleotidase